MCITLNHTVGLCWELTRSTGQANALLSCGFIAEYLDSGSTHHSCANRCAGLHIEAGVCSAVDARAKFSAAGLSHNSNVSPYLQTICDLVAFSMVPSDNCSALVQLD